MERSNRFCLWLLPALVLLLFAVFAPTPASADTFTLTIDHCTGGCGTAPFGTIQLTQGADNSTVHVDISLNDGNQFVHSGLQGSTIAFSIDSDPTISLKNVSLPGWTLDSNSAGSIHFDGFGYFDYSINCCFDHNGTSNAQLGTVSFDLANTDPGGTLNPSDFYKLSTGGSASAYFGVDILSSATGNSGPVGDGGSGCVECSSISSVPEPGTLLLLGSGLSGLALWFTKRRI